MHHFLIQPDLVRPRYCRSTPDDTRIRILQLYVTFSNIAELILLDVLICNVKN